MPVSARNNGFGTFEFPKTGVIKRENVYYNGYKESYLYGVSNTEHVCARVYHTANKALPLGDGSTSYRKPSSYIRNVFDAKINSGVWTRAYWGETQTLEGDPETLGGTSMFAIWPVFHSLAVCEPDTNLQNQAVTECLLKLADGKVQVGASLGEAVQTWDTLAGMAGDLLHSYKAAKRGDWRSVSRIIRGRGYPLKNVADRYLMYKYGVKPMMQDIHGLFELGQVQLRPAMLVSARRVIRDHGRVDRSNGGWYTKGSAQRSHTCQLTGQLNDAWKRAVNQAGLVNPASIAWELVPFSFVLDWALPIGSVLEALTATNGLDFVGGYRSVWGDGSGVATQEPTGGWTETSARSIDFRHFGYFREAYSGWPRPMPYFKSPFSTSNVQSALALFGQKNLR